MVDFLPIVEDEQFLPPKEWHNFIDLYLEHKTLVDLEGINYDGGVFERMNACQKFCVNEIKKSWARKDYKNR